MNSTPTLVAFGFAFGFGVTLVFGLGNQKTTLNDLDQDALIAQSISGLFGSSEATNLNFRGPVNSESYELIESAVLPGNPELESELEFEPLALRWQLPPGRRFHVVVKESVSRELDGKPTESRTADLTLSVKNKTEDGFANLEFVFDRFRGSVQENNQWRMDTEPWPVGGFADGTDPGAELGYDRPEPDIPQWSEYTFDTNETLLVTEKEIPEFAWGWTSELQNKREALREPIGKINHRTLSAKGKTEYERMFRNWHNSDVTGPKHFLSQYIPIFPDTLPENGKWNQEGDSGNLQLSFAGTRFNKDDSIFEFDIVCANPPEWNECVCGGHEESKFIEHTIRGKGVFDQSLGYLVKVSVVERYMTQSESGQKHLLTTSTTMNFDFIEDKRE